MDDPVSARLGNDTMLRNKFEFEKRYLCRPNRVASPSNISQKQPVASKAMERDEIVRHMSNLPSYLENGKATPDRALSFGVMDWGRLESWQYQRLRQGQVRSNKCSPSSSVSSPLFSTDGSSLQSSRDQVWSPARQEPHRVTLQSHFNISSDETVPAYGKSCLGNADKFQDSKGTPVDHCTEKKTIRRSGTDTKDCKMNDSYPHKLLPEFEAFIDTGDCQTNSSSLKGKMKVQDEEVAEPGNFHRPSYRTCDSGHLERRKTVTLLPSNFHGNSETNAKSSAEADHRISEKMRSYLNHDNTPISYPLPSEVGSKNFVMQRYSARNPSCTSSSRSRTIETKKSFISSNNSDLKSATIATGKHRSMSPIRRFSFTMGSKSDTSTSTTKKAESPTSRKSMTDNSYISNRSHSSPLKRLLEPLFSSKATNSHHSTGSSHENLKILAKAKSDSRHCQEVITDDVSHRIGTAKSTSTTQALFQTAVKNGRPMFTFAVENNSNVLAATVRDLSSSGKDNSNKWIYTFFTVEEVKKKNGGWLSQTRKDKGHGYVPNVTAQMKVSNPAVSDFNTREFVLFHVDRSRLDSQIPNIQPHDELAAIVVKFSKKVNDVKEDEDSFSTTVVLPGGNHGISSKGKPSPLIDRWVSSGVCDCGGWDLGCRLRTLTNHVQSSRRSNSTTGQFELFVQGDVINERRLFNLCPLKEGMYSVEYNSSISPLQAFSICISVVDCRKSSQHTESSTYVAKQIKDDQNPVRFASFPPLSPVGRV